jgi:hypothetical protein
MTSKGNKSKKEEESFEDLLRDIKENPERIMDETLTEEQILKIQREINPYAYVADTTKSEDKVRVAASSYTNLRMDYLRRFVMTSMVGFLFRMKDEWTVPAEKRRWVSKAEQKRGKKEEKERLSAKPLTPDDILVRVKNIQVIAQNAKGAEEEAKKATAKVLKADDELKIDKAAGDKSKAQIELQEETLKALLKNADTALAKARGLQYAATYELRKFGLEADLRIDSMAAVARQHKEVAAVIDQNPIHRPKPGRQEMPAEVAKEIIDDFLREWFEYNPDAHVRSAYDEFVIRRSLGEEKVEGLGTVKVDKSDPERLPLEVVRAEAPPRKTASDKTVFDQLTVTPEAYNSAVYMLRNPQALAALLAALKEPKKFIRYLLPIGHKSESRYAASIVPPQDTFHRWNYYIEVNYEKLRTATDAIYHEKPDLDWALILYEYFEGTRKEVDGAFESFRDKHQDEVISDIKGIDFGGWTLLGDFKENREKINFYNKNTDVLKRILDRHAEDKKLGQELMRNRVRKLKAKNIREDGPDAPGLSDYKAQTAGKSLSTMGAERVISREEMYRLERSRGDLKAAKELEVIDQCRQTIETLGEAAKVRELKPEEERRLKDAQADLIRAREMIEVPDEAIQVDVWTHDAKTGKFGKTHIYTKAETPVHLEQGGSKYEQPRGKTLAPKKVVSTRKNNLSADTKVKDLAPFAQFELARQIAGERLKEKEKGEAPLPQKEKPNLK